MPDNQSNKDYDPEFFDTIETPENLCKLLEDELEAHYLNNDFGSVHTTPTDKPTGFVAQFPSGRRLRVTLEINESEEEDNQQEDASLYIYMDAIFVNRRSDEYVASCMLHTDTGDEDVTIEASHSNPVAAREKLCTALRKMGVREPQQAE